MAESKYCWLLQQVHVQLYDMFMASNSLKDYYKQGIPRDTFKASFLAALLLKLCFVWEKNKENAC